MKALFETMDVGELKSHENSFHGELLKFVVAEKFSGIWVVLRDGRESGARICAAGVYNELFIVFAIMAQIEGEYGGGLFFVISTRDHFFQIVGILYAGTEEYAGGKATADFV